MEDLNKSVTKNVRPINNRNIRELKGRNAKIKELITKIWGICTNLQENTQLKREYRKWKITYIQSLIMNTNKLTNCKSMNRIDQHKNEKIIHFECSIKIIKLKLEKCKNCENEKICKTPIFIKLIGGEKIKSLQGL